MDPKTISSNPPLHLNLDAVVLIWGRRSIHGSSNGGNGSMLCFNLQIILSYFFTDVIYQNLSFETKNCNLLCDSDFSSQTKHTNSLY
jgi:hypothetical protein